MWGRIQKAESFAAIDFETADYYRDSACAVAVVLVEQGQIVGRTQYLIRPPRKDFVFSYLHGITWEMVRTAPAFAALWPELEHRLKDAEFVAAHNARFDRSVLHACCKTAGLEAPKVVFECTVKMARHVLGIRPARLDFVCGKLGIPLEHHNALSDAEACARIVLAARQALSVRVK